ncbi:MAG: DUF1002 domain-containing protein [Clostridium sp.]|nr:DUF1002 domain-containing protein [Clostridium sp.]
MKKKTIISKIILSVLSLSILTTCLPSISASADSFKSVTLGADLSQSQKDEMLKYFNISKNEANILEITSKEEYEALGNVASASQLGNKSISSSYVEPTNSGGLNITTNNLTWVTDAMIKNALITAGVENAIVKASAPFKVSGTAALTGILKGFENSSAGTKIDEAKKEAANNEIVVTGDLGEKIGQNDATNLINDVKKEIIKEQPSSEKQLNKIVDKSVKDYKNQLSDEDISNIKALMTKINELDLNYSSLKDQLNDVTNQLKDKLTSDEAKGFFAKVGKFFGDIWDAIKDLFSSDSSSTNTTENSNKNNSSEKESTNSKESTNTNETTNK